MPTVSDEIVRLDLDAMRRSTKPRMPAPGRCPGLLLSEKGPNNRQVSSADALEKDAMRVPVMGKMRLLDGRDLAARKKMTAPPPESSVDQIKIRLARPRDAASIARFNNAMAVETESRSLAEGTVVAGVKAVFSSTDKGFYVVAEHGGKVVGALMVTYEWSDWRNGFFWWIQSVYVEPDFRRLGIYRLLYAFVVERAQREGNVYGFRLYVERDNAVAQKVYANLGMHETNYLIFEQELGL